MPMMQEKGLGLRFLEGLGYPRGEPQPFVIKRVGGVWLMWMAVVILLGTVCGGSKGIHMSIFDGGFVLGTITILGNRSLYKKLGCGRPTKFQKKMTFISIALMFLLVVGIGGPFAGAHDYRMMWLSALLAIGIHFLPFAAVHGRIMIPLAIAASLNASVGMMIPTIPFDVLAYTDVGIKLVFGILMFVSSDPRQTGIVIPADTRRNHSE